MAMQPNMASVYISAKDETKAALKSITQGFTSLSSQLTGLISVTALVGASFMSLKKYADLMDFEKFGVGTDKALIFSDTLKLAGMEMAAVDKAFTELTVNVEKGIRDEKIQKTFSDIGISMDKLKNAPIGDIYDEIFKKLGQIEDKAKGLALAKEVFGKNGAKIFDAAQDGELQKYKEYMSQFSAEVKLATKEADNLFKELDQVKQILTNDLANAWGPILIPINALIKTVKELYMETNKAKSEFELIGQANYFGGLIAETVDWINIFTDGMARAKLLLEGLWLAFNVGIDTILATAEAIKSGLTAPLKITIAVAESFWETLKAIATMDFSGLKNNLKQITAELQNGINSGMDKMAGHLDRAANNSRDMWDKFGKAFDLSVTVSPQIDKEKFKKNLSDEIAGAQDAINKKQTTATRTGIGFDSGFKDQLDKQLKMLQLAYDKEKYDINMMSKYNEMYRQNNIKSLEDYYNEKMKLQEADYNAQKANIQKQMELVQKGMSGNLPEKDRIQYQEKLMELQLQLHKAEEDYKYTMEETNNKAFKDRLNLRLQEINVALQLNNIEEQKIQMASKGNKLDIFQANEKIVENRKKAISVLEEQIQVYQKLFDASPFDENLRLQLESAKLQLEQFKDQIDPIAMQINEAFTGAFAGFFMDIMDGTKSVKDAFLDMAKNIERTISNLVAQALAQNLMGALFGTGQSGGIGSFFSGLFGRGSLGGMGGGGLFGGALATGGYLDTNKDKPYLVGEKGAELFFPGKSGYVMNNEDTQKALNNGGGRPIVMNITTQDADSFRSSKGQIMADLNRAMAMSQRNL